jgi:hypothetical protein
MIMYSCPLEQAFNSCPGPSPFSVMLYFHSYFHVLSLTLLLASTIRVKKKTEKVKLCKISFILTVIIYTNIQECISHPHQLFYPLHTSAQTSKELFLIYNVPESI